MGTGVGRPSMRTAPLLYVVGRQTVSSPRILCHRGLHIPEATICNGRPVVACGLSDPRGRDQYWTDSGFHRGTQKGLCFASILMSVYSKDSTVWRALKYVSKVVPEWCTLPKEKLSCSLRSCGDQYCVTESGPAGTFDTPRELRRS